MANSIKNNKPLVLVVLDGYGIGEKLNPYNAIAKANTPNLDRLFATYPHSELETSGESVGLPHGQMGNSEVGHMSIGSGRIILQELPRINKYFQDKLNLKDKILLQSIEQLKISGKSCHLLGLMSDGGVHGHIEHLLALAEQFATAGVKTYLHLIFDGRDVGPNTAIAYLPKIKNLLAKYQNLSIASCGGRFYYMDRDKNYDRIEKASRAMLFAEGEKFTDIKNLIEDSYKSNINDEFILPTTHADYKGMNEGDLFLITNFRADRARQIVNAIIPTLKVKPICMTEYSEEIGKQVEILFPQFKVENTFAEVISNQGLKQLRIAETEKYAHVSFFFNGGVEDPFPNETRMLIQSPHVKTYDLKPEMSSVELTDELVNFIKEDLFDVIIVNYANCDMVGHTGNMEATIKAVEAIDQAVGRVAEIVLAKNGILVITADHGNAEEMYNMHDHTKITSHSLNPVPFVIVKKELMNSKIRLQNGALCDISPTLLKMLGIKIPSEMTGKILLEGIDDKGESN